MSDGRLELQSVDWAAAHILGREAEVILDHAPVSTSIQFGKFMLDTPRPAGPTPKRKKPKK